MPTRPLVSIVVPVLGDTAELAELLESLVRLEEGEPDPSNHDVHYEVIVVNGDSEDTSVQACHARFPTVRWAEGRRGRANQMNVGAGLSRAEWLLFLHADARLSRGWFSEMQQVDGQPEVWGAFTFALDSKARMARVLEHGVALRVKLFGLPYGDQGIFVRRMVFQALGGYSPLPIMEDIELVRRLRHSGPVVWSSLPVRVSARRWERDGWLRRSTLNVLFLGLFLSGVSARWLARQYYGQDLSPPSGSGERDVRLRPIPTDDPGRISVIMPALDEEAAIGHVLAEIPEFVTSVIVVDNGSTDRTAQMARAGGAEVVSENRKGYGRACLAGLRSNPDADLIVFLDADRSDFPSDMSALVSPILDGSADFVLGYRGGVGRPLPARLGTSLCVFLINLLWQTEYRDLGPFRAIRRADLDRLKMADETWGWTIEMQVKAAEAGLRMVEVPVRQRPRIGTPKISGTLPGAIRVGTRMLTTIWALWRTRRRRMSETGAAGNV